MTRIEEGLERTERVVESNNRFLESFSSDLRRYADSMNNLANRIDGVIATNNQDRQEANSRLATMRALP
jgi:ATP phosphoribosyltransferase